jgi:phosphohistidine swiveling domain-containing protein
MRRLGIDYDTSEAAIANILSGVATGAVLTGKMVSGKDTVAQHLADHLESLGNPTPVIHRSSDPIREELNEAIAIITEAGTQEEATANVATQLFVPDGVAIHVTEKLFETTRWTVPSAEERSNVHRYLLVYWADRGRRDIEPEYWVRSCFTRVVNTIASGHSALLSGGRYPNEIRPAQLLGLLAVRIAVDLEVQIARVRARDDIEPDPELFLTENECALDDYIGFNLKVTNNGTPEPTVDVILRHIEKHIRLLAGS